MEAGFVLWVSDYQHYVKSFEKSCFQVVLVTRMQLFNFVADFFSISKKARELGFFW